MGDRAGLPAELGISKDPSKLVSSPDSSLRISFLLMERSLLSPITRFLLVETTGTMGCVRGVWNISSGDSLPLVFSRSVDNKSWTDRGTSNVKDNPTPGSSIGLSPRVTGERRGGGDPPDSAVEDVTRAPSETETTGRNSSSPSPPLSPVGRAGWTEASSVSTVSDRPTSGSATRLAIAVAGASASFDLLGVFLTEGDGLLEAPVFPFPARVFLLNEVTTLVAAFSSSQAKPAKAEKGFEEKGSETSGLGGRPGRGTLFVVPSLPSLPAPCDLAIGGATLLEFCILTVTGGRGEPGCSLFDAIGNALLLLPLKTSLQKPKTYWIVPPSIFPRVLDLDQCVARDTSLVRWRCSCATSAANLSNSWFRCPSPIVLIAVAQKSAAFASSPLKISPGRRDSAFFCNFLGKLPCFRQFLRSLARVFSQSGR